LGSTTKIDTSEPTIVIRKVDAIMKNQFAVAFTV
jgi:hypothetical protein